MAWLAHARTASVKRLRDEARLANEAWLERSGHDGPQPPLPTDDATWFASLARSPGRTKERLDRLFARAEKKSPQLDIRWRLGHRSVATWFLNERQPGDRVMIGFGREPCRRAA